MLRLYVCRLSTNLPITTDVRYAGCGFGSVQVKTFFFSSFLFLVLLSPLIRLWTFAISNLPLEMAINFRGTITEI